MSEVKVDYSYINRYGDEFKFYFREDGNIQWEGNFKHHRIGWPNVYTEAFAAYQKDGGKLSLEEFKKQIFNQDDLRKAYGGLVTSDRDTIDMVDPSGGPYMFAGQKFMKKIVKQFIPNELGYIIVV